MRLRELDASFVGEANEKGFRHLDGIDGAQGVMFQCPKCAGQCQSGEEDGRKFFIGAHYILCWFRNPINALPVPDSLDPKPGRWNAKGTGLDDLTFVPPGSVSVLLQGAGCGYHGFIRDGEATLS